MPSEVATFSVVTESIRRVAKTLHTQESEVTLRGKGKAPLGLLFISGRLIERSNQLAELVAHESCCHWLIIPVAGVLHHESEHDNDSAAAGVLFTKNQPKVFLANDLGPELGDALIDEFKAKPVSSSLVLQRGTPDLDGWLGTLREATAANTPLIWGG
ncbi:MAG: hypothetical protein MK135_03895, partial [Polyangiaceae bacterium]|nr:hypothetical protein [Polyangiaceae bacterium]